MKIMEWNIGGAILKDKTEDLNFFSNIIALQNPDIIVLFETHRSSDDDSQTAQLAKKLGYNYFYEDVLSDSHLNPAQKLCQSIISRRALTDHSFRQFINPNLEGIHHGKLINTHDKGVSSVKVAVNGVQTTLQFLHAIPFIPFGVESDSPLMRTITTDMESLIDKDSTPSIIIGDFNINDDDLLELFPGLQKNGFNEVQNHLPTLSNGNRLDRSLYKGLRVENVTVINNNMTQHYPLIFSVSLA